MTDYQMGAVESKFADMIWSEEPIQSTELVKMADGALGWKKSTTYTVLRRLCDKGIFENREGTVKSLISREEFYAHRSEKILRDEFSGSLPAFVAAFSSRKKLSAEEVEELRRIIESYEVKND